MFSTVGVLLGLLLTGQPFGIVMSGVGVIALAGIVVNNNIVLIDTYNELRKRGLAPFDAVLRTGAQRLRPVLLTTVTTVLGLLPMVLKLNIDLVARTITCGGPSTDWWVAARLRGRRRPRLRDPAHPGADALPAAARGTDVEPGGGAPGAVRARLAAGRLARLRAATRRVGAAGNSAPLPRSNAWS